MSLNNSKLFIEQLVCAPERITELLIRAMLVVEASGKDEARTITVALEETQLSYPMFKSLGHYQQIPAVRMVVTTEEALPKLSAA